MPFVLIIAFAASLGLHAVALFGPDIDLSVGFEPEPLQAELRLLPKPLPRPHVVREKKPKNALSEKRRATRRSAQPIAHTMPVLTAPDSVSIVQAESPIAPDSPPVPESRSIEPRLPVHGMIRYRVDRGDSGFEIGVALHEWTISDGCYRLTSSIETTGLVWLIKSYRMEMESRGRLTESGLQPDFFVIRRNHSETKEKAFFDWETMKVRVGERGDYPLAPGSQDLLSFNYQLGYLPHLESGWSLPVATGKKYGIYRLDALGDEVIEVPAGTLRTLHLRAPGQSTTELWLAYDYLLLPVKIRHVDGKGDSLVQVATEIQLAIK